VNVATAIITSIAAVRANVMQMAVWAALIVLFTAAGLVSLYVGLIVAMPLIGHATWHAYKDLVIAIANQEGRIDEATEGFIIQITNVRLGTVWQEVIDEDGKNNPCDEDEDDHDPEPVQVPQMSLGNRVWLDDGAGGGMINNGLIDVGEAGVDNVLLFLLDSEFNAVLGADGLQRSARTNPDGYYLFDELAPGDYVVCVDVRNFQPGAPLEGTDSSVPTEIDPNADMDINNNGLNNPQPTVNGICSGVISLIFVQEPINEPDPGLVGSGGATDNNSNITLDFGFYPLEPTALDETEEPGRRDRILFIPLVRQ